MFPAYVGFIGDQFFLLSIDSTYSHIPGDKRELIFFRLQNFFQRSINVQIGVLLFVSPLRFYANLVQIDLIQFEFSNCIRSICTKTNTHSLHTNLSHSISRQIGHVIQIVVHQFVRLSSAKKNPKSEKNLVPLHPQVRVNM